MRADENDELFATHLLGTMRSPGVVTFSGHDRPKNWDIKNAKGQAGASTSLNGDNVGSFEASYYLVEDGSEAPGEGQFSQWEVFQRLIKSTTDGPSPKALPIYHPDLADNGFTEVVNGGVSGCVHDGKGGKTYKVKYLEYKPARPKPAAKAQGGQPQIAGGAVGGASKPDPNAAAKAELAALLAEARRP